MNSFFSNALIQLGWVKSKLSCFFTKLICFKLLTLSIVEWKSNYNHFCAGEEVKHRGVKLGLFMALSSELLILRPDPDGFPNFYSIWATAR